MMRNTLTEENVVKIGTVNSIDIYNIPQSRFKTGTISIFLRDSLDRGTVTMNALAPAVLRRGSRTRPTFRDIALCLEELYGASFDCGISKKGECQIVQFNTEYVTDRYTGRESGQFEKVFGLVFEILTQPVLENGRFKDDYVSQEKDNLKRLIEGRINDKLTYAVERCFEETCRDEPFGIYEYGSTGDLEMVDDGELYMNYRRLLETLPIDVYVTGEIGDAEIRFMEDLLSSVGRKAIKKVESGGRVKSQSGPRYVEERMNVNQGKLSLGFRTGIYANQDDYYPLLVYNGILGGGIHSKLFQNVREKASLAYYAFSRLEKFKGLMAISSGIEIKDKDRALEIILEQLEEMRKGNISDYEFEAATKSIDTGINSLKDSQFQVVDYYLGQSVANTKDSLKVLSEKVKKVSKQDVVRVSENIRHELTYFLTSREQ